MFVHTSIAQNTFHMLAHGCKRTRARIHMYMCYVHVCIHSTCTGTIVPAVAAHAAACARYAHVCSNKYNFTFIRLLSNITKRVKSILLYPGL